MSGETEIDFVTVAWTVPTVRPRDSAYQQWRHRDVTFSSLAGDLVTQSRSRH